MNNSDTNFKIEEGQWSCFRDYSSSLHTKFRVEHFRESQSLTWRGPWSFLEAAPAADIRQCRIVFWEHSNCDSFKKKGDRPARIGRLLYAARIIVSWFLFWNEEKKDSATYAMSPTYFERSTVAAASLKVNCFSDPQALHQVAAIRFL